MNTDNKLFVSDKINEKKRLLCFIFLLPILMVICICLIYPMIRTIISSIIGYRFNYKTLFEGYIKEFKGTQLNEDMIDTFIRLLLSVPVTVTVSMFLARVSSCLHIKLKYILCILFLIVSVNSMSSIGIASLLDTVAWSPVYIMGKYFGHVLMIFTSFLIGVGPLYLLFTIYYINKCNLAKYLHIAVSFQIIFYIFSNLSIKSINESLSYINFNRYINNNYNHFNINDMTINYFQGESYNAVILEMILVVMIVLFNWIVRQLNRHRFLDEKKYITKEFVPEKSSKKISKLKLFVIFALMQLLFILLISPLILTIMNSYKYAHFIPKIETYRAAFFGYLPFLGNSIVIIILSVFILALVSFSSNIGLSMFSKAIKTKILWAITFAFFLIPITQWYMNLQIYTHDSLLYYAIVAIFRNPLFGLCIMISSDIFDKNYKYMGAMNFRNILQANVKKLFRVLPVVIILSLPVWFDQVDFTQYDKYYTLYQCFIWRSLVPSNLNVMVMGGDLYDPFTLPIYNTIYLMIVIIAFTPALIKAMTRNGKE